MQEAKAEGTGLELSAKTPGKTQPGTEGGAKSGALGARTTMEDPELAELVEAWPTLPEATRADIMAMVRTTN